MELFSDSVDGFSDAEDGTALLIGKVLGSHVFGVELSDHFGVFVAEVLETALEGIPAIVQFVSHVGVLGGEAVDEVIGDDDCVSVLLSSPVSDAVERDNARPCPEVCSLFEFVEFTPEDEAGFLEEFFSGVWVVDHCEEVAVESASGLVVILEEGVGFFPLIFGKQVRIVVLRMYWC